MFEFDLAERQELLKRLRDITMLSKELASDEKLLGVSSGTFLRHRIELGMQVDILSKAIKEAIKWLERI